LSQMQAGLYELGCPAIEQSYGLDPRPGTLFTLAECEAKRGRIVTALRWYDEYLAFYPHLSTEQRDKQGDRAQIAKEQRALLTPQVPELTLRLPKGAPEGTIVRRNGVVLPREALGVATRLDPGEYTVTTRAPKEPLTVRRVVLRRGDKLDIVLDVPEPSK